MVSIPPADVTVCSIVRAELFYGTAKSNSSTKTLAEQQNFLRPYADAPFDERIARVYGKVRANLEKLGTPIGLNDLLIASIALANGLILVTHNVREFSRINGLQIEDWEI